MTSDVPMIVGTGTKRWFVHLRPIHYASGSRHWAGLMGFHAFTGSDTTGGIAGKGKRSCWKLNEGKQQYSPSICINWADSMYFVQSHGQAWRVCLLACCTKAQYQTHRAPTTAPVQMKNQAEAEKLPAMKNSSEGSYLKSKSCNDQTACRHKKSKPTFPN